MRILFLLSIIFTPALLYSVGYQLNLDLVGTPGHCLFADLDNRSYRIQAGKGAPLFNPLSVKENLYNGYYFYDNGGHLPSKVFMLINRQLPAGFAVIGLFKGDSSENNYVWVNLIQADEAVLVEYKPFDDSDSKAFEQEKETFIKFDSRAFSLDIYRQLPDQKKLIATVFLEHRHGGLEVRLCKTSKQISFTEEENDDVGVAGAGGADRQIALIPIRQDQEDDDDVDQPMSQSFLGSLVSSVSSWMSSAPSRPLLYGEDERKRRTDIIQLLQNDVIFDVVGWSVGSNAPYHLKCKNDLITLTFGKQVTESLIFAIDQGEGDMHISFKAKLTGTKQASKARIYIKDENNKLINFLNPYFDVKNLTIKRGHKFDEYEVWFSREKGENYTLFFTNHPETEEHVKLEIKDFVVE